MLLRTVLANQLVIHSYNTLVPLRVQRRLKQDALETISYVTVTKLERLVSVHFDAFEVFRECVATYCFLHRLMELFLRAAFEDPQNLVVAEYWAVLNAVRLTQRLDMTSLERLL